MRILSSRTLLKTTIISVAADLHRSFYDARAIFCDQFDPKSNTAMTLHARGEEFAYDYFTPF